MTFQEAKEKLIEMAAGQPVKIAYSEYHGFEWQTDNDSNRVSIDMHLGEHCVVSSATYAEALAAMADKLNPPTDEQPGVEVAA